MGGFAGKPLTPESPWGLFKLFMGILPAAMIANKFLQGNIWGIPNRDHGIVPIAEILGKPAEEVVEGYMSSNLDTSGFVGDEDDHRSLKAARPRPTGGNIGHTSSSSVGKGGSGGGWMSGYFGSK